MFHVKLWRKVLLGWRCLNIKLLKTKLLKYFRFKFRNRFLTHNLKPRTHNKFQKMDISNKKHFLTVKDYSVSKETFDLYYDETLDMLITSPQPSLDNLGKYYESVDYISHTDSKRSLFEKAYHFVKSIALKNKLNLINSCNSSKGKLLDIGAGTGDFLLTAKENGWNTIGIEPS